MNARAAILLVLGLAIGVLGTVFVMRALNQRNPFPRAVMSVMNYHFGELEQSVKAKQCDAAPASEHLLRLESTAADVPSAFPGVDQPFLDAAGHLRTTLENAVQAHPADCAALAAAIKPVGEACQSCHEKYR